jgi:hypothetical protein
MDWHDNTRQAETRFKTWGDNLHQGEGMMNVKRIVIGILAAFTLLMNACVYIVLPEDLGDSTGTGGEQGMWTGVVTNVGGNEAGDLHVDITIRNDTGDWSTMQAVESKPAVLKGGDGTTTPCDVVFIGTGGHRFAPGFQMKGYTTEENGEVQIQPLFVECKGATADPGSMLSIDYIAFQGILDDYDPEANKIEGTLELSLDDIATDLTYPVASEVEGLIQEATTSITGLSENVVTLLDTQRTESGFEFTWQNFNPTKFPLKTHIGVPPVIGADGIIYGVYETLDLAPIPITPANSSVTWSTDVDVPENETGFYILLSVESNKPRTYKNYVLDISDK